MKAFRVLLLLYPRAFRRRFGDEMAQAFETLLQRTREERGIGGVALLWLRTAVDTAVSGLRERLFGRDRNRGDGILKLAGIALGQAVRRLRRAPGFVAAFVLTLGLAIGVNSSVFSVVNGVLLQPLPFPDADRILLIKHSASSRGADNIRFSFMELDDYRAAATTIDELVEFRDWEFTVLVDSEPTRAIGAMVTSNYFDVLEMRPALGRVLDQADDEEGSEAVMILTDEYWERMYGRDPSVIGRVVDLEHLHEANPYTPTRIVGVLEPGLHYSSFRRPDFYINYSANAHYQDASMRDARGHRMTEIFARMAPGVTAEVARAELESITAQMHREYPEAYPEDVGFGIEVVAWKDELTRDGRATFLFLMGTVSLVLLLAAANVTNLTLTRLIRKQGELSTRTALGARASDLRMQLTAEHVVLGLAGGVVGIVLAYTTRDLLAAYAGRFTIRAQEVGVDWTVLGVTLGGSVLLASLLAWLPGLPVAPGVGGVASARSRATDSRWRKRLQRGLVVGQLALSFTLLTGTGLLVRSLIELTSVDPGFNTDQVLTMRAPTGPRGLPMADSEDPGWDRGLDEIRAFPGVRSAVVATWAPLTSTPDAAFAYGVRLDEADPFVDRSHLATSNNVSPGYFETLGIPLLAGRTFGPSDREDSPDVVILNESMARAYFGDADPIGRRIWIGGGNYRVFKQTWYEIVGVVADSREHSLDQTGLHTFYRPAAQTRWGPAILMSYQGDAAPLARHVRDVIHRMEPDRAVGEIESLGSIVERDMAPSRLNTVLFGSFAALALLIAALGVLGTLAFSVSQRVREFGIRMAVGADRGSVLRDVMAEGAVLVGVALVVGIAASLVLGRLLSSVLFGVDPVDPGAIAAAASLLGTVALGAALLPALRATQIEPTQALKGE